MLGILGALKFLAIELGFIPFLYLPIFSSAPSCWSFSALFFLSKCSFKF
tara:strand:+ start:9878 stop:10024 length:147 start_codon:yes stop_codon:yes gene_type:complete